MNLKHILFVVIFTVTLPLFAAESENWILASDDTCQKDLCYTSPILQPFDLRLIIGVFKRRGGQGQQMRIEQYGHVLITEKQDDAGFCYTATYYQVGENEGTQCGVRLNTHGEIEINHNRTDILTLPEQLSFFLDDDE